MSATSSLPTATLIDGMNAGHASDPNGHSQEHRCSCPCLCTADEKSGARIELRVTGSVVLNLKLRVSDTETSHININTVFDRGTRGRGAAGGEEAEVLEHKVPQASSSGDQKTLKRARSARAEDCSQEKKRLKGEEGYTGSKKDTQARNLKAVSRWPSPTLLVPDSDSETEPEEYEEEVLPDGRVVYIAVDPTARSR
ncbi:hypothetical protein FOMPIDRAFT_1043161 [Fomitopsis schrenkii]|uniref:Uncharacterized protein n=1 Tax=Fomitopsis schrenkii TaxID=2126942 RepID=S8FDH6_FOMSC|nr:hypothetical protein FOMPIDRAFT_1043161 [Fomitopsis schrenkii]